MTAVSKPYFRTPFIYETKIDFKRCNFCAVEPFCSYNFNRSMKHALNRTVTDSDTADFSSSLVNRRLSGKHIVVVSKNIKNFEGAQRNLPGTDSPLRYPSLTRFASDGGNTRTTALIKSAGVINISPEGDFKEAEYSITDLSCDKFMGLMPLEIGNLVNTRSLKLSHNCLSGIIPTTFSNLKGIGSMDLSFNKLSGGIPSQLANTSGLGSFNVSFNNLSGMKPQANHIQTSHEETKIRFFVRNLYSEATLPVLEYSASLKSPSGEIFMTPADLMRAVVLYRVSSLFPECGV
ncbi:hypothetical protein RJ639_016677 [Escallonia herrerae]|uniref:Uncharacterized protein n=1 Tax=Escallonia herrerae TaxID=1293975 RepID=A0AA89AJF1_9ASTE|nr:hypothetical protein RJ639_016677 [Escallonia herrerae]